MTTKQQEQSVFNFLALPNEIIERIFLNFNDDTLLTLSQVCTRFNSIVTNVFGKKYANRNYEISGIRRRCRGFHRAILNKFGSTFKSIFIYKYDLINIDKCLMKLIQTKCTTLKKLELNDVSINLEKLFSHRNDLTYCSFNGITLDEDDTKWFRYHLPNLMHFEIRFKNDIKYVHLMEFFKINTQIEVLYIDTKMDALNIINNYLPNLRSLKIVDYLRINHTNRDMFISFESLESFEILSVDPSNSLQTIERCCKQLKYLTIIYQCQKPLDDNTLRIINMLNCLQSLVILYGSVSNEQIRQIGQHLPQLSELQIQINEQVNLNKLIDNILLILSLFPNLDKLMIRLNAIECPNGVNYDFHTQYLAAIGNNRDVNIRLLFLEENILISKDGILRQKDGCEPVLVHWIAYESCHSHSKTNILDLNENSLRDLFDHIDHFTLTLLLQTSHSMEKRIRKYFTEKYEHNDFNLIAYENGDQWKIVSQLFGQYFHIINLEIPSYTCYIEPYFFHQLSQYCTNIVELNIKNGSGFDIISSDFNLPHLKRVKYENCSGGDIDIGIFAQCQKLESLKIFGPISFNPSVSDTKSKFLMCILFLIMF